jgi:predicted transglutaminase-like cysteine proteinase
MQLGASAMPPQAYVAFCQRQPWECGDQPGRVLARAAQADAERAALFAQASPAMLTSLVQSPPASVSTTALDEPAAPELAALEPLEPLTATVERAPVLAAILAFDPATAQPAEVGTPSPPPPARTVRAEPQPLRMTPQLWSRLNRVNDELNRTILVRTDRWTYRKADYWTTPLENGVRYGDCEDFVLEKRRALLAEGLPREVLNIALVTTSWGESHAVLVVSTTDGDLVLDNLSRWIAPWGQTGYRFRQREVGGDPFTWAMVQDPARQPAAPGLQVASR